MRFDPRARRPNAFVHSLDELRVHRDAARAAQGTFDVKTRGVFDASEDMWRRLDIVIERKAEEHGRETWSMSSIVSIGLLEELRAAYRLIERATP